MDKKEVEAALETIRSHWYKIEDLYDKIMDDLFGCEGTEAELLRVTVHKDGGNVLLARRGHYDDGGCFTEEHSFPISYLMSDTPFEDAQNDEYAKQKRIREERKHELESWANTAAVKLNACVKAWNKLDEYEQVEVKLCDDGGPNKREAARPFKIDWENGPTYEFLDE